jgi:hypothetical protein
MNQPYSQHRPPATVDLRDALSLVTSATAILQDLDGAATILDTSEPNRVSNKRLGERNAGLQRAASQLRAAAEEAMLEYFRLKGFPDPRGE